MKYFSITALLFLLLLGCHKSTQGVPPLEITQKENINHKQKLNEYHGEFTASFEEFEFIYNGNAYHIIDKNHKLSNYISTQRADKQQFHLKCNTCLMGELIDKTHNKGHGFGHLEKYQQAIIVHDFC